MESLSVTPVGVGAAYGRPGEVQSAYVVAGGGTRICLDLGAGTLNPLTAIAPPETLDALVISHLHADHCADLLALRIYMVWGPGRGRRLPVFGPAGLRDVMIGFAGEGGWDDAFAFTDIAEADPVIGALALRTAPVPHVDPTRAIRVDAGGRSLTYSADCRADDALVDLARGTDLLIAECGDGAARIPDTIHMNGADAGRIAAAAGAGALLLTHCYPEHDRDAAIAQARAAFDGPVEWARQGRRVRVG